jgi:hypothetical protein
MPKGKKSPPLARRRSRGTGGKQGRLFNFLAVVFLGLSVISIGWVVEVALNPYGRLNPFPPSKGDFLLPTSVVIAMPPTETQTPTLEPETPTPSSSATPFEAGLPAPSPGPFNGQSEATQTQVPFGGQATQTPTSQNPFGGPTIAPSASLTLLPSVTPRPSPTRSVFTFTASMTYQVHPVQLCDWMGVAGTVTDLEGRPSLGAFVHIWGLGGVDQIVGAGENPSYGPSGWEVRLARAQIVGYWTVQLVASPETKSPLSESYTISMPGDCQKNLALIHFQQNH